MLSQAPKRGRIELAATEFYRKQPRIAWWPLPLGSSVHLQNGCRQGCDCTGFSQGSSSDLSACPLCFSVSTPLKFPLSNQELR